jgi:hypothetical protein
MFDRNQPYNDLPLLPPAVELETKAILKQAIAASRAVADLRGKAQQIPNQRMMIRSTYFENVSKKCKKIDTF